MYLHLFGTVRQAGPGQMKGWGETCFVPLTSTGSQTCFVALTKASEGTQVPAYLPREPEGAPFLSSPSTITWQEHVASLPLSGRSPLFARWPLAWVMKKATLCGPNKSVFILGKQSHIALAPKDDTTWVFQPLSQHIRGAHGGGRCFASYAFQNWDFLCF